MIEFNTFLRSSVFLPLLVDVAWGSDQQIVIEPTANKIETLMLQLLDKVVLKVPIRMLKERSLMIFLGP